MLLKSVKTVNSRGHVLNLPLNDPDNGFTVRDIQGLGPVKAEVVSAPFAALDGEQYHSSSRVKRNIIFNLGLHPDYGQQSVYDLRNQLYAYFMPKSEIKLKFELYDKFAEETLNVEIDGVVEYAEPSIFSKDPNFDVSVLCHQPDFIDPTVITVNGTSVVDLTYLDIDYKGTIDTGVLFKITPNVDLVGAFNPTGTNIWSVALDSLMPDGLVSSIRYYGDIDTDDVLTIDTNSGKKIVQLVLTPSVTKYNTMHLMEPDDETWLRLYPGLNRIVVITLGDPDYVTGVPYTIEYITRYGGI